MFKRLIHYDFLWDIKLPAYYFAAAVFAALLSRLTDSASSAVGVFLNRFFFGFAISMIVSTLINALIRCWLRFVLTSYKDQSYLYHTLPVKRETLFFAHLASSVLSLLVFLAGAALVAFLLIVGKEAPLQFLRSVFQSGERISAFFLALLCLILEFVFLYLCGAAGTVLGYTAASSRTLKSVLISVGLYLGANALILGALALLSRFLPSFATLFSSGGVDLPSWQIFLAVDLLYLLFCGLWIFLSKRLYEKKINVE